MDSRLRLINKYLKQYDRELYAIRLSDSSEDEPGMVQIYRNGTTWDCFEYEGKKYWYTKHNPIFILALTDSWRLNGKPVEWGIEPLMRRIREMDQWRDDSLHRNLVKERERKEELKQREYKNNIRALAYDMRSEFAKTTNDINTSILEKTDKRRIKDGYYKS